MAKPEICTGLIWNPGTMPRGELFTLLGHSPSVTKIGGIIKICKSHVKLSGLVCFYIHEKNP